MWSLHDHSIHLILLDPSTSSTVSNFRQLSNLLAGHDTYTEAYAEFLQTDNLPTSLEVDIFNLDQYQHDNTTNDEVRFTYCANIIIHTIKLFMFNFCFRMRKILLKPAHNEHKKEAHMPENSKSSTRQQLTRGL